MAGSTEERVALVQSLDSTGRAIGGPLGAELLVYAADLLQATSTGPGIADALLARALQLDPTCHLAIDRTLRSAAARGDWLVLADALRDAAALVEPDEAKAVLLAQRAEVLGHRLGRLEEAKRLYVEAASRSATLAAAALAAAEDVESRAAGRTAYEAPWPDVTLAQPAFDPLVGAGVPVAGGPDPVLDRYRSRLAEGYDAAVFAGAIAEALDRGVVDAARRVLPGMSAGRRLAELEGLIAAADAGDDAEAALRFRTAAFAEAPVSADYYAASRRFFRAAKQIPARLEVLLRRRRVSDEPDETEALLSEFARLAASAGHHRAAAEAYLEILRMAHVQDWSEVLAAVDQLSRSANDRRVWSRALAAASARAGLDPSARRQLLWELARVLEEELDDAPAATAVRAELAIAGGGGSRPPDAPMRIADAPTGSFGGDEASPATIRAAWQRGDLATAVRMLKRATVLAAPVKYALWHEVAELAEVLGQDELARLAYISAADQATAPGEREAARAGRARVAERMGAKREAAQALIGVASARVTAQAHLAARDVMSARAAFGRALDQDPADVAAAAQLARLHAEDGNRRTVEQLADAMSAHAMSDDRRSVWLTELAMALHRLGDHSAARRDFVKAMRLDVANTDAASGLVALGADAHEDSWIDEGLSSLRARWAARGEWMRAFVAAAVLVGRKRASAADRLTYESLRSRFCVQPHAALTPGWIGRWLGLVTDVPASDPLATISGRRWTPQQELGDVVGTLQALFRAPEPHWFEDDGVGIRMGAGSVLIVGRSVPRWRRRWRFEVGRAMAALVEPILAPGLEPVEGPPTVEQQVLDRAGLVAAGDPAVALAAVGAREPRGRRLVPFAVSDALIDMWRSVGMGLGDLRGGPWPRRPVVM